MIDTVKAVFFGLIGVRRKVDHEKTEIRPVQLIVVAVVFVVLFIFTLRTIVGIVTS